MCLVPNLMILNIQEYRSLRTNMNLSNILSSVKSNKKEYTVHGKQHLQIKGNNLKSLGIISI